MEWLKRIFGFGKRPVVIEGFSGKLLNETPEGKLGTIIQQNKCPDCGHEGFYEGPSGGMSTNIYCMNSKCRSAFNFTNVFDEGHAQRIGKAPNNYYPLG